MVMNNALAGSGLGVTYKPTINLKGRKTILSFCMYLNKDFNAQYLEFDLGSFNHQAHDEDLGFWQFIVTNHRGMWTRISQYGSQQFAVDFKFAVELKGWEKEVNLWVEQGSSIMVRAMSSFGDPVELTSEDARAFAEMLLAAAEKLDETG